MNLLSFLRKDLGGRLSFVRLFILNLSLGLTSLLAIEGLGGSIRSTISQQSKNILGADLTISARRPISDRDIEKAKSILPTDHKYAYVKELYSMVRGEKPNSRMVQVKAISGEFPFYGTITTKSADTVSNLKQKDIIWVYPEILLQLGLNEKDQLKVGESWLPIADIVSDDPSAAISTQMAPRIFMSLDTLEKTGLVRQRSIVRHKVHFHLPSTTDAQLKEIKEQLNTLLPDPDIRLTTHMESGEQTARLANYFNDFLGLTALSALFLSIIGACFLVRSFLASKINDLAIYISLGLAHRKIISFYLVEVTLLGLLSSVIAIALSWILIPFFINLTAEFSPFPLAFTISYRTVILALSAGVLTSLLLSYPFLSQIRFLNPNILLKEKSEFPFRWNFSQILTFFPMLLFFYLLCIWQANSLQNGSLFFGLLFLSSILLIIFGFPTLKLVDQLSTLGSLPWKWAIRYLIRHKISTTTSLMALGLGVLLINFIPQVKTTLTSEFESPEQSKVPSFFLFDIQSDQIAQIENYLKEEQIPINSSAPMIRAKLITVNDQPFEKGETSTSNVTREEERERRMRNRGFNLSYRDSLLLGESIVKGKMFSGAWNEESGRLPEISIEERFAGRLDLKMNDKLKFLIQGLEMEGVITSFRKVKWNTFNPNFFILFQPGVLEFAPKTHLATIKVAKEKRFDLQNQLVQSFPNVSIIDVTRLIEKIAYYIDQMGNALRWMTALVILCGLFVIFSISYFQAQKNHAQVGIYKAMGAKESTIRASYALQTFLLTLIASGFGILFSFMLNFSFSYFVFESIPRFEWETPLITTMILIILSQIISFLTLNKLFKISPKSLINQ